MMDFTAPVSADSADTSESRPVPAPGGAWRTTEVAILHEVYPKGGAAGVHQRLPHRTLQAIRAKANTEKIECKRGSTSGLRFARIYPPCEHIDQAIREGYIHATEKGAIKALAERIGRPAWWVQKRGAQLGVTRTNRTRLGSWLREELAILEEFAHLEHKAVCRKLKEAGFKRTPTAVEVKIKRLRLDREDPDRWSATAVAPFLGVNPATIADWVERRGLPAKRESWGPNGRLMIQRKKLRTWIANNCSFVDLRRVDQPWFKELMWGADA